MPKKMSKTIFVIMPFQHTPTRSKEDLTSFFEVNLKEKIEGAQTLLHKYTVARSGDSFGITDQIIRDLYAADIVIADLSGNTANPNVMFELGIRLAISNKPVILIREQHSENKTIFDIHGYYTFPYNPHQYRPLEDHLISKIQSFEAGIEQFKSPVLQTLKTAPEVIISLRRLSCQERLRMLLIGIMKYVQELSIQTTGFLKIHHEPQIEKTISDTPSLIKFLSDNQAYISQLPWDKFDPPKITIPSLGSVLIESPIAGIVPGDVELLVVMLLWNYYCIVTNPISQRGLNVPDIIILLLHDSILIEQLIQGIRHMLANEDESMEFLKVVRQIYNETYLCHWIDKDLGELNLENGHVGYWIKSEIKSNKANSAAAKKRRG